MIFLDNKYTKTYYQIINRAKSFSRYISGSNNISHKGIPKTEEHKRKIKESNLRRFHVSL